MANRVSEIRRTGIDVPNNNVWFLDIYGDPSQSPGFQIGIGSVARQWDSAPASGAMWAKIGPLATDWVAIYFGVQRALLVGDLPDITDIVNQNVLSTLENPLLGAGLTGPDDFRFRVKAGLNSL